jgi:hypothetical protein
MTISISSESREKTVSLQAPTTTGSMKVEASYGGAQVTHDSETGRTTRVEQAPTIETTWETEPKLEDPALLAGSVQEKNAANRLHPPQQQTPAIDGP